jgi:Cu+-exporting ATPase
VIDGGVQRIAVDVTDGYFDPTMIELASGIPSQLVFSEGQGCLAAVSFPQFGIERDLTSGGATVEIPALRAGEYPFSCGMEMVYGVLVVR